MYIAVHINVDQGLQRRFDTDNLHVKYVMRPVSLYHVVYGKTFECIQIYSVLLYHRDGKHKMFFIILLRQLTAAAVNNYDSHYYYDNNNDDAADDDADDYFIIKKINDFIAMV